MLEKENGGKVKKSGKIFTKLQGRGDWHVGILVSSTLTCIS